MKKSLYAFLSTWLVCSAAASVEISTGLQGKVTAESAPLARASVYAYELAELDVKKVLSDGEGSFLFEQLPAGIYKLIAFKAGFEPAVVMLSRAGAEVQQFVELRLQHESTESRDSEDYWSLRAQIPADVLRDIETVRLEEWTRPVTGGMTHPFTAALQASTGFEEMGPAGQAQLSGAELDLETKFAGIEIGLEGQFWQMQRADGLDTLGSSQGEATSLVLSMRGAGAGHGRADMTTVNERFASRQLNKRDDADFERYQLHWEQPIGDRSHSSFSAQYLAQSNYFQPDWVAPLMAPQATRSMNISGSYSIDLSDRTSLETGIRYRQQDAFSLLSPDQSSGDQRALEVFGRGGWRAQPKVLVEYGIYSQLQDGSMALAPQGNVVVQLGSNWQTAASVSQRIEQGDPKELFNSPVRFGAANGSCQGLDEHCYRMLVSHQDDSNNLLSVAAVHREVAETLQLHFNDDFFNQLESLYLVRGDELPELQVVFQRQITPQVLARLESNYAEGGGGMLYATDNSSYQNQVRYLVTSVDTRFQRSSTGVFLAFHHLEQALESQLSDELSDPTFDLERLQLMLSQDLNVLLQAAGDLAVHVNFEVSRGSTPYSIEDQDFDELRRRVSGGVSLRF